MNAFGIWHYLALLLELCVPSYALRLVRRFGAQQVGGFLIIAFFSLAVIHGINPFKASPGSGTALAVLYAGASILLLIGMGHTETLCVQRQQARLEEEKLREKLDAEARERADDLLKIRQEMAQEIVRLQQQLETISVSERQYRLLFTQSPHPMWIFDLRSGRILAGNLAALEQYGFTQQEFTSLAAKDLVARDSVQAFQADAAKPCVAGESRGIWQHRRKDRTMLQAEVMAMDMRFGDCPARLIFAEDIAPRIARETALCESERMRVLRRVAEGVAYHFGHILSVVEGQAGLLMGGPESIASSDHVSQVLAETKRGTALVRQLLAVAGCDSIQTEPVELNSYILQKQALLARLIPQRIRLELRLAENLPPALADLRLLEQILLNLVLNAKTAVPECGTIDIETGAIWIDNLPARGRPSITAKSGHFIRLTVRDNGSGMSREVRQHLYEPFFTTREDGRAMGLGLATVHGAVKQLGGWVECATELHHGTEFNVYLPAAPLKPYSATKAEAAIPPETRETILLIETNDQVRDLARHILQRNGYKVIEADSPQTAALLLEAQAQNVEVLLTDLNFPDGTTGTELAEQIRRVNPQLKVVYSSGALSPDDTEPGILTDAKLLMKPYTPD